MEKIKNLLILRAKLFALFCVFALSIGHVWAGGGYTVKLTASANPSDAATF